MSLKFEPLQKFEKFWIISKHLNLFIIFDSFEQQKEMRENVLFMNYFRGHEGYESFKFLNYP